MYAIIRSRSQIRVPTTQDAPQFLALFSSRKSSSNFSGSDATFTISYLTNSCGLPLKDAVSVSKKLCLKSRENSDAVLQLLNKYEFTNAQISRLVKKWPRVLQSSADKTLWPKLEFFVSIGVPPAVLPRKLSEYPFPLGRSLENYFIPWYKYLKRIVESDKNVAAVFLRSPMAFTHGWPKRVPSNIAILREQRLPKYSIASLLVKKPSMLILKKELFSAYVDRVVEMGFHRSRVVFVDALQVFGKMSESTVRHKMDVYRRCGWSESDLSSAFLKYPLCMKLSQKKIRANMDFLVDEVGFKAADVAQRPGVLDFNVEKRMRPRWIVTRVLKAKGLMKESTRITFNLFRMSEAMFLRRYIFDHEEEIPQLLDIYRGKLSLSEIGLDENVMTN
ncbi:hypothetical protein C2S53_015827 [Perilla frutescens var. hirtella]|uniref:Uncharacterized protein n=1 Tax=Perilla frutescens var. hirtella TaxID=608512 RepID=A0AAD4IUE3_PERFH|nr:hypothetical protein C2S53_015827 [Perilla frutescens var. hirtella]